MIEGQNGAAPESVPETDAVPKTVPETASASPETVPAPTEDGADPSAWGPRYTVEASRDESSGTWVIRVPELDVLARGESREAALLRAEEAAEIRLAEMAEMAKTAETARLEESAASAETAPDAVPDDGAPSPTDAPSGPQGPGTPFDPGTAEDAPSGAGDASGTDPASTASGEEGPMDTASGTEDADPGTDRYPDLYEDGPLFSPRIAVLVLIVTAVVAAVLHQFGI